MDRFLDHITGQRAKLKKQISKLQNELEKLDYSEKTYRASGAAGPTAPAGDELPLADAARVTDGYTAVTVPTLLKGTIKDRVLAILKRNPEGLTSSQILNALQLSGLPDLMRESLSPQLSRLRNQDHKIDLNHGLWTLKHETQAG